MPVAFLDPGQFSARLELEAPVATPDGQGGAEMAWDPVAALWALVEPVSQAFGEIAGAEAATISHRIWMRFRADIVAGQRLRKGARLFTIRTARDPDESGRYLVCYCEEAGR